MNDSPVLKDKRAVIFGAGGSIGAAVAGAYGAEGAEVFLAGRSRSTLDPVARQINEAGGRAHAAVVDALDPSFARGVVLWWGSVQVVTGGLVVNHVIVLRDLCGVEEIA